MHKSQNGQWDLINSDGNKGNTAKTFDVLLLQEPYIDFLGNPKATRAWKLIKPTICSTTEKEHPRSIILVNAKIPSDCWEELRIDDGNRDVTAVQLKGQFGRLTIINVYNDQDHQRTIRIIDDYINRNRERILRNDNDYIYLGGDFNRHHPLWEDDKNTQLLTPRHLEKARSIINIIDKYELEQTLPKGIPTFYSAPHKTWTRPDNVFCSNTLVPSIVTCDVANELISGPGIDHMPIITTLDLRLQNIRNKPRHNFRETDWTIFEKELRIKLETSRISNTINDEEQFHTNVNELTRVIQETIDENVELSKPFPLSKRWWNTDLSDMKKKVRILGAEHYRYRGIPEHASHEEFRKASNKYSDSIKKQKAKHWEEYLQKATEDDASRINFFISEPPTDGSSTRIPTLRYKTHDGIEKEATNNDEKTKILSKTFFPPKPTESRLPADFQYPEPVAYKCKITEERVAYQINRLSPYKAPGPDRIPNVIWKRCQATLTPILTKIFQAAMKLRTYSPTWKEWNTIVLKKPGKPRYDNPKAWRPIALMNTMGKIMTALAAEDLTYVCEKYQLLPDRHFGGRPGRTTTDAIHLLTYRIKAAWRKNKVVAVLFLDIEGAFPNANLGRLLHNMRKRRVPEELVQFTKRQLEDRRTKLCFDDYTSDWIRIDNGTGQGDPASMPDYIIYDADLIDILERIMAWEEDTNPTPDSARARGTQAVEEDAAAFVDDTWYMGIGDTFEEANATLKDMMERKGGGLEWSTTHFSKFELSKTILIGFTNRRIPNPQRDQSKKTIPIPRPPLNINGTIIRPSTSCRYLGVKIDQELKWNEQAQAVIEKATKWTLAFRRMAQPSKGVSARLMLKLYKTVLLPKVLYGVDTWFRPIMESRTGGRRAGSVGAMKQLTRIQRIAATAITGALRTTATDILEVHAGLLPMELAIRRACQRAAVRLATLPKTHPLYAPVRRSAAKIVKRHASPLHHIMALCPTKVDSIEKIQPVRRSPAYIIPARIVISKDREESKRRDRDDKSEARIYSDGSAYEGGVGASAVMYRRNKTPKILKYYLGPITEYTVANAEAVGAILALHLVSNPNIQTPKTITMNLDSQATLRGLNVKKPRPGQHLLMHFLDAIDKFKKRNRNVRTTLNWITAHDGVEGNEKADEMAKEAAQGSSSQKKHLPIVLQKRPLPISSSAIRQQMKQDIDARWKKNWEKSPRHKKLERYDNETPNCKFIKKTKRFPRKHISILTQLRTGHIPLQNYLFNISKADSPQCPTCPNARETTSHYILECSAYRRERYLLRLRAGRNARNLQYLLGNAEGMKHLMKYIAGTGRFRQLYGSLTEAAPELDQENQ